MSTRPKRQPRPVRIPITSREVPMTFGLQMRLSLEALRREPAREHFDGVARCLNVVQVAIEDDARFTDEALRINAGARALNQIAQKVEAIEDGTPLRLHPHELAPVELAINAAEDVIPRLSITSLNDARIRLQAIRLAEKARVAA